MVILIFLLKKGLFFISSLWFCLGLQSSAFAQGDLMVMPKRIVFEGSKRSAQLNLANTGKDTANYAISLVHYKMQDDGSFIKLNAADTAGNFADRFVRFFPRSVRLGPGESQTVRIQLMRTGELLPGEYMSHLYFRARPIESPLGQKDIHDESSNSISVRLTPIFGISIPVIIRSGEPTTRISLSKCSFEMFDDTIPVLKMTLNRTGNMSAYGDILVEHISPENKATVVGKVQGLALYTPNLFRNIKVGLNKNAGVDFNSGKLHVVYRAQKNGNPNNIAQTEVYLN